MKAKTSLIIASLLLLAGCAKEPLPAQMQEAQSFDFTLEAELDDFVPADQTKASATTVVRLSWSKGDEISVVNLTTGKALGGTLVADATGSITTFSGTLTGTVHAGDKVAFLYPSQGYTQEQDYEPVTIDFSHQGGQSKENVPICVYAVSGASGNTFSKTTATFKFLMSYIQFSFANLANSELIESVKVDDMGSSMTLSLSADGFVATPSVGTITMSPNAYSVSSKGTKSFYMTFAESPKVASRKITVQTANSLVSGTFSGSKLVANTSYTATVADFVNAPIQFEDPVFKAYCVSNFDTDGDGEISLAEARDVTSINCSAYSSRPGNITSLGGIEFFTSLNTLNCQNNRITSIDLSKNTVLTYLYCSDNQLTSLNLNNNPALSCLECKHNNLTNLDLRNNLSLKRIECSNCGLSNLYLGNNSVLTELYCGNNQLTSIDVSCNIALSRLDFRDNQLSGIDLRNNTALTYLVCFGNQLTSLDLTECTALVELSCMDNKLTSLDLTECTALVELSCMDNKLTSLDLSRNAALENINCGSNQLIDLDVSHNTALKYLFCNDNKINNLDVSKNTALFGINCEDNQLTSLDLSKNTTLDYLSCIGNQLTSLDLSNNTTLRELWCCHNDLTSLDITANSALSILVCSPMPTLEKLIMTEGQIVEGINSNRNSGYIPDATVIEYRGNTDMGDGGELED